MLIGQRFVLMVMISAVVSTGHAQISQEGDIELLMKEIRTTMPDMGSNGFVIPTESELTAWGSVFIDLNANNIGRIQSSVSPYGYGFIRFYNIPSAETLYVLKENVPIQRGWGTYIFNPRGTNDMTIEVPHPRSDTNTTIMGIRAFTRLNVRWYFLAGTHRYANTDSSSDMSHVTQAIFHKAHETLATNCAIQPHGFDRSNPVYNGYPDVVISNGTQAPPPVLYTLQTRYVARGFSAGVFSVSTYASLWRLGATKNKQGQWSNANGKTFVHIEHDLPIRLDSVKTARAIEAMYETFTPASSADIAGSIPLRFSLEQNYPNPFNPATTFSFDIPYSSFVTLKVYDILGREVATVVEGIKDAGHFEVQWSVGADGRPADNGQLSSGVYFYRLSAADFAQTRKLLLLK